MSTHTSRLVPMECAAQSGAGPRVLVFDSGLGGLSVLQELRRELPAADITYVADDAAFPYGDWQEAALKAHTVALMGDLIETHRPDLVVIACNTASTLVLAEVRARHAVPFVGTVPAIKPAAAATRTGLVSVLATPGTVARDYTRQLVEAHAAGVDVTLVGATRLAALAEAWLRGEVIEDAAVVAEIEPCFVAREGKRTDVVVLGCTHYPLLLSVFERIAPWPVAWIDGARAIARRAGDLAAAGPVAEATGGSAPSHGDARILFTSGKPVQPVLAARLAEFGLTPGDAV